ncbi:inverse autotransporter beta domain-containing protein [Enterobacteriaceae bacterium H20N1]|uniref:Inverse autotransporter beta domain-containing protein n=1 Tax=Dryocola boscaweniae TaxID=2925397 RepID=A0A9X3AB52_9ENTR|nr:inverse autotransporter beta domain-containing protein [Dryocola boscaweniae]MCT4700503.1 inverse autotransporter beta domain-containing protein [Dryocola boscaweniae]MCT4717659.1 inverse autotransporter beta domain-containing protein [Dryocola boscaweniae]
MKIKVTQTRQVFRKARIVACLQLLLLQTATPVMLAFTPAMAASPNRHELRTMASLTPEQRAVVESNYISRNHFKIGYTLTNYDTLKQVAQKSHISLLTLREINRIQYPHDADFYRLKVGDWLMIPRWTSPQEAEQAMLDCYNLANHTLSEMSEAELAAALATPAPALAHRNAVADTSPADNTQQQDKEVAKWLTQTGNIANSSNSGEAAKALALNSATQATSSSVEAWLAQFGHARIQLNVNDQGHLDGSNADLLLPLYDTGKSLIFTQLGIHDKDDYTTFNMGLGQRWFGGQQMLGYNAFIDQEMRNNHTRLGLGTEYWRDYLKLAGNAYIGLTGWKESKTLEDYEEKAASGFDLRGEGYLPDWPQLGAKLSYEQYFGDNVGLFGKDKLQSDPFAVTAGVNYTPVPLVTAGLDYKQGKDGANDTLFNLQFNYLFGVPWQQQISPDAVDSLRTLNGSRLEFVNRNNNMVMQYKKMDVIKLSLPASLHGNASAQQTLIATVKAKHGLSRLQWDDANLIAAGGSIQQVNNMQYQITLPSRAGDYSISAIAYDTRGNASNTASTLIRVEQSAAPDVTITSLTPDITSAPADGSTPVTYTLKAAVPAQNTDIKLNEYTIHWSNRGAGDLSTAETPLDANGQAQVRLTSTVAGGVNLTATLINAGGTKVAETTSQAAEFTSEYNLDTITSDKNSAKADGLDAIALITRATNNGNALNGYNVKWTFEYPDGTTKDATLQTNSDGNVSTSITSNLEGPVNIIAELTDETGHVVAKRTANVSFTSAAQEIGSITFSDAQPHYQWTDRSAALSVEVNDSSGAAIPDEQLIWDISNCSDCSSPAETKTDSSGKLEATLTLDGNAAEGDRTIKICSATDSNKCATKSITFLAPPTINQYQTLGTSTPKTGNEFGGVRIKGGEIKVTATGSTSNIVRYTWTSSSSELPVSGSDNWEHIITLNDNVGGDVTLTAEASGLETRSTSFRVENSGQWYYLPDGAVFYYANINASAAGCRSATAVDNESEMKSIYNVWGNFFKYSTELNRKDGYGGLPVWISGSAAGNTATLFYFGGVNEGTSHDNITIADGQAWAVCK